MLCVFVFVCVVCLFDVLLIRSFVCLLACLLLFACLLVRFCAIVCLLVRLRVSVLDRSLACWSVCWFSCARLFSCFSLKLIHPFGVFVCFRMFVG